MSFEVTNFILAVLILFSILIEIMIVAILFWNLPPPLKSPKRYSTFEDINAFNQNLGFVSTQIKNLTEKVDRLNSNGHKPLEDSYVKGIISVPETVVSKEIANETPGPSFEEALMAQLNTLDEKPSSEEDKKKSGKSKKQDGKAN